MASVDPDKIVDEPERLTPENMQMSLVPVPGHQMMRDMPELADQIAHSIATGAQLTTEELPIWWVLTLAAGATGIAIEVLYNDPVSRSHALAVLATQSRVKHLLAHMATEQQP